MKLDHEHYGHIWTPVFKCGSLSLCHLLAGDVFGEAGWCHDQWVWSRERDGGKRIGLGRESRHLYAVSLSGSFSSQGDTGDHINRRSRPSISPLPATYKPAPLGEAQLYPEQEISQFLGQSSHQEIDQDG